ncbi:MAG: tetratricopeptide repeat protein [Chitinophagales bacterium]
MKLQHLILFLLFCFFSFNDLFAQSEQALVRKGNQQYIEGNFSEAEVDYRKGINKNPETDLEASVFNLGNALYKQDRFEEAATRFERAAEMAATSEEKAKAFHNLGNSLLKNSKLKESIEAYKNALRNNSTDPDTRYNLAYAQQLLKQQQEQQQEQQEQQQNENQDQNEQEQNEDKQEKDSENQEEQDQNESEKEEQEEQQQEQNKEEQSQEEQQQQQQKDKEEGGEEQNQQQSKPQETRELTKEEAARLLEALKNEELKVQQKLNRQKGKANRIKIEKDW